MKKFSLKKLLLCIAIPLITGFLISLAIKDAQVKFSLINKPSFAPPKEVFPIVWTVLYILMGVSLYLVSQSKAENDNAPYFIFSIQLALNAVWCVVFFNLSLYLAAFIIELALCLSVLLMIINFYKINHAAAFLQIPYLIWVIFAGVLNFSIYLLN